MIDLKHVDFSHLESSSKQSFQDHRKLIKQLGKGDKVLCQICQDPLILNVDNTSPSVRCRKGCTHIQLELD